jgi:hypothetical protein
MIPQYNDRQLVLYKSAHLGALDPVLAAELYVFAQTVPTISGADRRFVVAALKIIGKVP